MNVVIPKQPAHPEHGAWDKVRSGWRQVYGSFKQLGVSVETHHFDAPGELDWGRSFHRGSVELCLNLNGLGEVAHRSERTSLEANTVGFYARGDEPLQAHRAAGQSHRFVTVEFSRSFLSQNFAGVESQIDPVVRRCVSANRGPGGIGRTSRLNEAQRALAMSLIAPPVVPAALPLWHQSKVLEAASLFLFTPAPELFCARQKRLAHERVERVCQILRANLLEPPSLGELGREVGVSQFYLSRMFSQEVGLTIPQYLRRIRMERAAELLRDGRHNVTEAAFAVGYASLGHFSKSFCEVIGCCPTLYPQARALQG